MVPSPPSGIGRGSVDPALLLKNHHLVGPDDPRPTRTSSMGGDNTGTGGAHRQVPAAALRAEAADPEAKWQSAIDAATD